MNFKGGFDNLEVILLRVGFGCRDVTVIRTNLSYVWVKRSTHVNFWSVESLTTQIGRWMDESGL